MRKKTVITLVSQVSIGIDDFQKGCTVRGSCTVYIAGHILFLLLRLSFTIAYTITFLKVVS